MKYIFCITLFFISLAGKSSDTLYVEDAQDIRYLRYLDTLQGYEIGYSVAKNIADSVKRMSGNNSLDDYFLKKFTPGGENFSGDYFYEYHENVKVAIGHVNDAFRGMKNDNKFPWKYLETQYKRLDAIRIQPCGVMQGGELPSVYVYAKPTLTVIYRKVKRYTVLDRSIKFAMKGDGKTQISYIRKFHYSKVGNDHEKIDSIEKLDPIREEHLFY